MIKLPPGVTINHEARVVVKDLTDEMVNWYKDIGGRVHTESWYDARGKEHATNVVALNRGRNSYKMQSGTGEYILNFNQDDLSAALMFLIKFSDYISSHNLKGLEQYVY